MAPLLGRTPKELAGTERNGSQANYQEGVRTLGKDLSKNSIAGAIQQHGVDAQRRNVRRNRSVFGESTMSTARSYMVKVLRVGEP